MQFKAKIEHLEFRGLEVKESKKDNSEYMIVKFDNDEANRVELIDRDMERKPFYKRGSYYDVLLDINHARDYTNFKLIDVTELTDHN